MSEVVKYLLEGVAVALAAYYIPGKNTNPRAVFFIALTAAVTFAIIDKFAPLVSGGTRQGAGFGIGLSHVGGSQVKQIGRERGIIDPTFRGSRAPTMNQGIIDPTFRTGKSRGSSASQSIIDPLFHTG